MTLTALPAPTRPATTVGVLVTRVHHPVLADRVRECGTTYTYERHLDTADGVALAVRCQCPTGHGVARIPWRGWFQPHYGRFDLADVPTPAPIAYVDGPVDLSVLPEDLAEDEFGWGTAVTPAAVLTQPTAA